jgi:hypothetical protein
MPNVSGLRFKLGHYPTGTGTTLHEGTSYAQSVKLSGGEQFGGQKNSTSQTHVLPLLF